MISVYKYPIKHRIVFYISQIKSEYKTFMKFINKVFDLLTSLTRGSIPVIVDAKVILVTIHIYIFKHKLL